MKKEEFVANANIGRANIWLPIEEMEKEKKWREYRESQIGVFGRLEKMSFEEFVAKESLDGDGMEKEGTDIDHTPWLEAEEKEQRELMRGINEELSKPYRPNRINREEFNNYLNHLGEAEFDYNSWIEWKKRMKEIPIKPIKGEAIARGRGAGEQYKSITEFFDEKDEEADRIIDMAFTEIKGADIKICKTGCGINDWCEDGLCDKEGCYTSPFGSVAPPDEEPKLNEG